MDVRIFGSENKRNLSFKDVAIHQVFKRNKHGDEYLKLSESEALNLMTNYLQRCTQSSHVEGIVGKVKTMVLTLED